MAPLVTDDEARYLIYVELDSQLGGPQTSQCRCNETEDVKRHERSTSRNCSSVLLQDIKAHQSADRGTSLLSEER